MSSRELRGALAELPGDRVDFARALGSSRGPWLDFQDFVWISHSCGLLRSSRELARAPAELSEARVDFSRALGSFQERLLNAQELARTSQELSGAPGMSR